MNTVLLVDDSLVALHVLGRRLRAEGFAVREESTARGASAVDPAELLCAIVDLHLADGEGPAISSTLRARRPALPVAFFTAGASSLLLEQARAGGPVFRKNDVEGLLAWTHRQRAGSRRPSQPPPTK